MSGTTTARIREALNAADYPADKDALVAEATRAGADDETVRALRAIPPVEYGNLTEVLRSTPIDDELEGDVTHAPVNAIEEELGENRGS